MVSVNATASTALATLTVAKSGAAAGVAIKPHLPTGLQPSAVPRLSPAVSDAIMKIGEIVGAQKLDDLPAEHAARLREFGADAAERVKWPVGNEKDFQSTVLSFIGDSWNKLEGFTEALANGTVKIQRAGDVEGLGYEMIEYKLYKDGHQTGTAGWSTMNREFYDAQAAAGVHQGIGSINGMAFYVTW